MPTQTLEELLVAINASTDKLRTELSEGDRSVKKFKRSVDKELGSIDKGFAKVTGSVKGLVGLLGAGLGLEALARNTAESIRYLEEVGRQADSLGASVESIQELTLTFREFDLEANDVADALGTLADRALEAEAGTKSFIDDFALLGVSVDDLRGKRPDQLFELIAQRIAQIEDPTRRTAGIVRIFGDELGRRLNPLLLEGSDGLQDYAQRWRELGVVVDEAGVRSAGAAAEKFRELSTSLSGKFTAAVAENADEIAKLADVMISATEAAGGFVLAINRVINPDVEERIGEVRRQIEILKLELDNPGVAGPARDIAEARLRAEREKLVGLVQQLSDTNSDQLTIDRASIGPRSEDVGTAGANAGKAWLEGFASEIKSLDPEIFNLKLPETDTLIPELTADQIFPARKILDGAFEDAKDDVDEFAQSVEGALRGGFEDLFQGLDSRFSVLLAEMAAELLSSQLLSILGSISLGPFGGIGKAIGSVLGFADGGRPPVGRVSMVGERGPELFMPDVSGRVFSAAETSLMMRGGGGGVQVNIHNAPMPANVQQRNVGGVQLVDIVFQPIMEDLSNNGPLSQALAGKFGLSPAFGR